FRVCFRNSLVDERLFKRSFIGDIKQINSGRGSSKKFPHCVDSLFHCWSCPAISSLMLLIERASLERSAGWYLRFGSPIARRNFLTADNSSRKSATRTE